jgi:hypothetical protein
MPTRQKLGLSLIRSENKALGWVLVFVASALSLFNKRGDLRRMDCTMSTWAYVRFSSFLFMAGFSGLS